VRAVAAILLAGLVFAVAACGGGGGGASATASESAATIAPASAPAFIAIDTNLDSDQWQVAEGLLDKFPGKPKLLQALRKELSTENVDFERDVKPALGDEIDVVWLDFEGRGDHVVGVTKPKDATKFNALLEKGTNPAEHAVVDGWTVFADKRSTIDAFRDATTSRHLADDAQFKDALAELPDDALAKAYVDVRAVRGRFASQLESAGAGFSGLDKAVWLAASVEASDNGVRLQGTAKSDGGSASNYQSKLLPDAPSGAILYFSFHGRQNALRQLETNPQVKAFLPQLEQAIGVTLSELEPLLANEGELFVRPGSPIPEVTLAVLVDDEQQALSTVDTLIRKVAAKTGTLPRPDESSGISGARELQLGPVAIHYAAFDGKLALTTSSTGLGALRKGGAKLEDDEAFKQAKDAVSLPDENAGFIYLNLHEAIPLIEGLASLGSNRVPVGASANLEPLQSFIAYAASDGSKSSFEAFLHID
jgi:uncharacterized protein DUF3352